MSRNRNRGGGIPDSVKAFAKASYKKHKKDCGDFYDSKKALRRDYFDSLTVDLPDVIDWLLRNSHKPQEEIQNLKNACYEKFAGEDGPQYMKYLLDYVDDYGVEDIPNIEYFPIILGEIIADIIKYNEDHQDGGKVEEPTDLYKLASRILKKRIKKAEKKGIPENIAFDLLTVMPVKDAAKYSPYFRVKSVFELLYHYGAETAIPFDATMKFLFDENDYKYVIGYALQERKEKYRSFNELQKNLFNTISTWCFAELEDMEKSGIREVLNKYIEVRKRDAQQGKDGNRRYYISSLPEKDYPKICKVVADLITADAENKKYL